MSQDVRQQTVNSGADIEQQRSDISHQKGRYLTERQTDRRADNSLQTSDIGYQTADSRRQQNHKDFSFSNLEPPSESKFQEHYFLLIFRSCARSPFSRNRFALAISENLIKQKKKKPKTRVLIVAMKYLRQN